MADRDLIDWARERGFSSIRSLSCARVTLWLSSEPLTKTIMFIQYEEQELLEKFRWLLLPADISMYKDENVMNNKQDELSTW